MATQPTAESALPLETNDDQARRRLLYQFCRVQFPQLQVSLDAFEAHLERAIQIYSAKVAESITWQTFLEGLYAPDWTVTCACIEGVNAAWETLFAARTGRSDCLLVDALRARSCRLYPYDQEKQENAVHEFWSHLIIPDSENSLPILHRYDGQRPLTPWLIRVFQNWHLSKLRHHNSVVTLPDDDLAMPMPSETRHETRWHEAFCMAARDWLATIPDNERLILGLRWRYKMSQRDVANTLGVHEGTISRQTDKLRDHAIEIIGQSLIRDGWTGDDLESFILTEMGGLLIDEPSLSADELARLVKAKGKELP